MLKAKGSPAIRVTPSHTGNLEKIGDMFGIIDLVEERLFVSINIHVHHKEGTVN
jgi:hypothetical protein